MKMDTKIRGLIKEMLNEIEVEDQSNQSEAEALFQEGLDKIQEGLGMIMTATDLLDPDMADALTQFIGSDVGPLIHVMAQSFEQAKEQKSNVIQGPWQS
jgi:hypothetical protein